MIGRPPAPIPDKYFCKYCEQPKLPEDMEVGQRGKISQSCCKSCRWARQAQWKREHTDVFLVQLARRRSREDGTPFNIVAEDIFIPEYCPALGIKLEKGNGKIHDASATIDRLKPELGYIKGNVAVISYKANRMRNNGTAEELRKIADWMDAQNV